MAISPSSSVRYAPARGELATSKASAVAMACTRTAWRSAFTGVGEDIGLNTNTQYNLG